MNNDVDDLPIVGPNIDLNKVHVTAINHKRTLAFLNHFISQIKVIGINHKRTLAFLNHFVSHTVKFLNRFSCVCEEKLADLSLRIQSLEVTVSILEAKLASIPGLEDVTVANNTTATTPVAQTQPSSQESEQQQQSQEEPEPEPEPEKPKFMTVAQDPRYAKYFQLLKVGVPVAAFAGKMKAEGLNPHLMETPDAPSPGAPEPESDDDSISEGSSASSFSDDEE